MQSWDRPPWNRWSFQHIREFLPTVEVWRGNGPVRALPRNEQRLDDLPVIGIDADPAALSTMLEATFTDGFLVLKGGAVAYERYYNGMDERTLHLAQSVTKSFAGALAGILEGQGVIDATALATGYLPELQPTAYRGASLQHLLESQAISRRWVAEDIRKKLSMLDTARLAVVQQAKAEAMVSRLRAAVASLEAAGLDARIRASKLRPITPDTLEFLYSHREVQITRRGERVKLKKHKNDYLQVYKVADVATGRALCFAHFHYKTQTRQNEAYEAAHLKQPGQEYLGREDQAEVEAAMFARIRRGQTGKFEPIPEIERGKLSLGLARRLFFSLD